MYLVCGLTLGVDDGDGDGGDGGFGGISRIFPSPSLLLTKLEILYVNVCMYVLCMYVRTYVRP